MLILSVILIRMACFACKHLNHSQRPSGASLRPSRCFDFRTFRDACFGTRRGHFGLDGHHYVGSKQPVWIQILPCDRNKFNFMMTDAWDIFVHPFYELRARDDRNKTRTTPAPVRFHRSEFHSDPSAIKLDGKVNLCTCIMMLEKCSATI
eukprot:SAG31_NODE_3884_length_3784_cov_2.194030_4_plen_150_part_00